VRSASERDRRGRLGPARVPPANADAIADFLDFDLHRHAHLDLLARAWKLRENVTAYDAMYVALAEALDALIVTCDTPLPTTPGHHAHIEAIE
jgi:predicted nucleic acid-binding protein